MNVKVGGRENGMRGTSGVGGADGMDFFGQRQSEVGSWGLSMVWC